MIGDIIIYISSFVGLYVLILWFLVLWQDKGNFFKLKLKKNYPFVCIIVPCFNEEKTIIKTVNSLAKLDYPKHKLEIFVVDDGSTDRTYQKAKTLEEKYKQVKVFRKENGGKYTALNYGLTKTKAEFVGCLDADSFVPPNALRIVMSYFDNDNIMAVTSSVKVNRPKNILQELQEVEYLFNVCLRKVFSLLNSIIVTPGPFSIYRKEVFDKVGLFRHGYYTEDLEIALRLQNNHCQIANAPNVCAYTVSPCSWKKLYQQRKRWYYGLIRNAWDYRNILANKKHKDLGLFILPMTFASIILFFLAMFYFIFHFIARGIRQILSWQAIGFDFSQTEFRLDWFFLNTQAIVFIWPLLLGLTIGIVLLGKKLSYDKSKLKKKFLFFILLHPIMYFIWWLAAIQAVVLKKENKW